MLINVIRQNWKRFLLVIGVYVLFVFVWFGAQFLNDKRIEQKDMQTKEVLSEISYSEKEAQTEIDLLETYLSENTLSSWSLGVTHKALAKLYYMSGNDKKYNTQISYAAYYLGKSNQGNELLDLNTQYVGKLYANGAYEACETIYKKMEESLDIKVCDADLQIAYYLGLADVDQMLDDDAEAKTHIDTAQKLLLSADDYKGKGVDQAKSDLLLVRMYLNEKKYVLAKKIMDSYSEDDTFGLDEDNMYLVCDYTIPYYEMQTKLALQEADDTKAVQSINRYLELCDSYNFRRMKLNLLNYIDNLQNVDETALVDNFHGVHKQLTTEIIDEFSEQYGEYLIAGVETQMEELSDSEQDGKILHTRIYFWIQSLFVMAFILLFISRLFMEMRVDGLTRLRNRKCYEEDRERLFHRGEPYYLMIMDIDDFKKVNDTFGHQVGDEVLVGISSILQKYENGYVRCYRYGGEEVCVIFKHCTESTVRAIAEQMRYHIEKEVSRPDMKITVSGGMTYSKDGGNVFRKADGLLYQAKANGKNQIVYEEKA